MLTRSTLLSSTTSTSRRRLYCSLPLAGDGTDPEILAGLLPSRRYAYALLSGDGTNRAGNSRRGLAGGACRAVRAQKVGRRDRAVGILGVGEGSRRRTAPSRRSGRGMAGSLARSGTRRIRERRPPRPFRGTRRHGNNSRQIREIRFCSAGVRSGSCRGGREKIELVIV